MVPRSEVTPPKVIQWEQFQQVFARGFKQGEQVAIVGPNGSGKSVLAFELCVIAGQRTGKDGRPSRVIILGIKPRDDTLAAMVPRGWPIIKEWPPAYGQEHCIVWPRGGPPSSAAARHRKVFAPLLDTIYAEGGQTVCLDEEAYFERNQPAGLGLSPMMEQFWMVSRAMKLSLIATTQRPRNVTRAMWSEPAWVIIFHVEDLDDLKRVAELSGRRYDVMAAAQKLGGHEFLCVRRQRNGSRDLYVSKVEAG